MISLSYIQLYDKQKQSRDILVSFMQYCSFILDITITGDIENLYTLFQG